MLTFVLVALYKFPEELLYKIMLALPKHRLELITKVCWKVHKKKYGRPPRNYKHDKVLNGEQLSALFAAFKTEKYRVLYKLQYIQALRPAEVLSFHIDRLFFESGTAEIFDYKKERWTEITLHPKSVSLLRTWIEDNEDMIRRKGGWLFFGRDTKQLSVNIARNRFREARQRAGLPEWCSAYVLRHTRLNKFYDYTKDLRLVAAFGRHSEETCMRYYLHPDKEKVNVAVCALPV